jgi:hypothetical protein
MPSLGTTTFSESLSQPALVCKVESKSFNWRNASTLTSGLPKVN